MATSEIAVDDRVQAQRACPSCHEEAQQNDVNKFRQVEQVINRADLSGCDCVR
jgi:hypothetical protein